MITEEKQKKVMSRITHIYNFVKTNPLCSISDIEIGLEQLGMSRSTIKRTLSKMINAPLPYLIKQNREGKYTLNGIGKYFVNPLGSPNDFDILVYILQKSQDNSINEKFQKLLLYLNTFMEFPFEPETTFGLYIYLHSFPNRSILYTKELFYEELYENGKQFLNEDSPFKDLPIYKKLRELSRYSDKSEYSE